MKDEKKLPKKAGRPKIQLDPKQASIFGYFRATYETMAEFFGCSFDTIQRAMSNEKSEFAIAYKKSFAGMKMKISEAQIKTAIEDRNSAMLIWLGKQYLGQRDDPQAPTQTEPMKVIIEYVGPNQAKGDEIVLRPEEIEEED